MRPWHALNSSRSNRSMSGSTRSGHSSKHFATLCSRPTCGWDACLRGIECPFHELSLPSAYYPPEAAREISIDIDAKPSLADVLEAHADRRSQTDDELMGLEDSMLAEPRTAAPEPASSEETVTVYDCLFTVIEEHIQHRRYAVRDLTTLERR